MLTNKLVLDEGTATEIGRLISYKPQSILITGMQGVGKRSVAHYLAASLIGVEPAKLSQSPNFKEIASADGIEAIRTLRSFLALKALFGGQGEINRVAFIDASPGISIESQNAILKLLEEPANGSVIILTAESDKELLPTITSRVRRLNVNQPDYNTLLKYLTDLGYPSDIVDMTIKIIGPLPGRITEMLQSDKIDKLKALVDETKKLLSASTAERLSQVDLISKNKATVEELVDMLVYMSNAAMRQLSITKSDSDSIDLRITNWQNILEQATQAKARLASNGQAKLILTDLMLNI